jgi:hypothetical protein
MTTMVLAGLWHGAGWTFLVWGALHGLYLVVNHLWRALGFGLARPLGWALTFTAVVIGWVVFRAESMSGAFNVLSGMVGLHAGVPAASDAALVPSARDLVWVLGASIVALALPNAAQFTWLYRPGLNISRAQRTSRGRAVLLLWNPTLFWSIAMSALAAAAFAVALNRQVDVKFLYFQF